MTDPVAHDPDAPLPEPAPVPPEPSPKPLPPDDAQLRVMLRRMAKLARGTAHTHRERAAYFNVSGGQHWREDHLRLAGEADAEAAFYTRAADIVDEYIKAKKGTTE